MASSLPAWLRSLTETLPRWIARVSHPSGPGRFRFAVDAYERYDIDSSCMLLKVLQSGAGGSWPLSEPDKREWVRYLLDLQRPEDGLLIDPAIERHIIAAGDEPTDQERFRVRFWTSRNALMSVESLGGTPRYPLPIRRHPSRRRPSSTTWRTFTGITRGAPAPVRDQSDAVGASLLCQAVALVCNLAGLRDELGWTPVTEFGMRLHERSDAGSAHSRRS